MQVILNKTDYKVGEAIQIRVNNILAEPVWYAKKVYCGMSFFQLETCEGKIVLYSQPCDWMMAMHDFTKLDPGEEFISEWQGQIIDCKSNQLILNAVGCYRIMVPYSTVEKRANGVGWGNDMQKAYSNQFEQRLSHSFCRNA